MRLSQGEMRPNLRLDYRRKIACRNGADEVRALVRAIAEGGVGGMAAAAESDGSAPAEPEGVSGLINDFEIAFDANGTVVEDCHFGAGHEDPPEDVFVGAEAG